MAEPPTPFTILYVASVRLRHLLRDLKLLDHPDLIVHLNPAFHQFHLCAVEIRKAELINLKLFYQRRQVFFL